MTTPTPTTRTAVTSLTTEKPRGLFLAHADRINPTTLRITSPVVVEAQMVPPRCRKPRVVQLFATVTADIAIDPTDVDTVMTWTAPAADDGKNTLHRLVVDTDTGWFYATPRTLGHRGNLPGPVSDTTAYPGPDRETIGYRLGGWPEDRPLTHERHATLNIIHPAYLKNGAPNPLSQGLPAVWDRGGVDRITHVEPTASTTRPGAYVGSVDVPYFADIDTLVTPVARALDDRAHGVFYLDEQLHITCAAPEVRYGITTENGELRLPRVDDDFDPRQGHGGHAVAPPINPLDSRVAARLGLTAGDGFDYIPYVGLEEAYNYLAEQFRERQQDLIDQVNYPDPTKYRHLIPEEDTRPASLAAGVSHYAWHDDVRYRAESLARLAETMVWMERDYPDLPRMR